MTGIRKIISIPGVFAAVVCLLFLAVSGSEAGKIPEKDIDGYVDQLLSNEHIEDEIIVKFKDGITHNMNELKNISANTHSRAGAVLKREFRKVKGLQLVKLSRQKSIKKVLRSYLKNPRIEYAEPNYIVHAVAVPDDPSFNSLWGLHNTGQSGGTADADIDAPEAWDISTGSGSVVIAVVDSGVAINSSISVGHPDLAANIWANTGETSCTDGIDNDGNGYTDDCWGWDFVDNDNDPMDYAMHGTHVAGTIAAVGNNSQGVAGVMWDASIMPLRFLDAVGSGTTANAISAILYASANGAHVINNSWGGGGFSQALKDAIDASSAVVVCAAGNNGMNNDSTPFYPASYSSSNLISVAATDRNDNLAYFSNYGATSVHLAAPGVSIYSTVPARNLLFFDNMSNLDNWDAESPWGLSTTYYSSLYSVADSPGGNYANNANVSLTLVDPISLSGIRGTVLEYFLRLETESDFDFLWIESSSNGHSWGNIIGWHGSTGGSFFFMEEDITVYDGQRRFYLRYRLDSDHSNTFDGAYIDNVKITSYSETYTGTEYAYFQGTSMAAPHVSGVAGLIKAVQPGLTNTEVINTILDNVDVKSLLTGKVLTEGRLNAHNALQSLFEDSDSDGVLDDGDYSGVAGDNPCTGGNTTNCDDNCISSLNTDQIDTDIDGVGDVCDNCREVANADQRDTNAGEDDNTSAEGDQHYGNVCDPDFSNNGYVGLEDFNTWRIYFRQTVPPALADVDTSGNNYIGLEDFNNWRQYFRSTPGPGIGD